MDRSSESRCCWEGDGDRRYPPPATAPQAGSNLWHEAKWKGFTACVAWGSTMSELLLSHQTGICLVTQQKASYRRLARSWRTKGEGEITKKEQTGEPGLYELIKKNRETGKCEPNWKYAVGIFDIVPKGGSQWKHWGWETVIRILRREWRDRKSWMTKHPNFRCSRRARKHLRRPRRRAWNSSEYWFQLR